MRRKSFVQLCADGNDLYVSTELEDGAIDARQTGTEFRQQHARAGLFLGYPHVRMLPYYESPPGSAGRRGGVAQVRVDQSCGVATPLGSQRCQ